MRYPLAVTSALDCALLTSVLNETDGPGGGGVDIATAEPAVNRWMECKSGLPRGQVSITVCFFFSQFISWDAHPPRLLGVGNSGLFLLSSRVSSGHFLVWRVSWVEHGSEVMGPVLHLCGCGG